MIEEHHAERSRLESDLQLLSRMNILLGNTTITSSQLSNAFRIIFDLRAISPKLTIEDRNFRDIFLANIQRLGTVIAASDRIRELKKDIQESEEALEALIMEQEALRTARRLAKTKRKIEDKASLMLASSSKRKSKSK